MANINKLSKVFWWVITQSWFKYKFYNIGKGTIVFAPLQYDNPKTISLSQGIFIAEGAWLMGGTKAESMTLEIRDKTVIGHYAHIVAMEKIIIENEVLIADRVFISDCTHCYENIRESILKQDVMILKPVVIGEGTWIGENVCICGASVGKHCVIGANSVVTKDIPDYSVAVGSPAKVIKKYDFIEKKWVNVSEKVID